MTKPALKPFDLSVFDVPSIPLNQVAVVVSIELSKVIEDPNQPRKVFYQQDLERFAEEILARGVMSPIQVKRLDQTGKAGQDGCYQIIQGARRYRASVLAGLKTIPAIVRTDELLFDDYSQVTENTQRENLSPLDIARFIAKRKELGESNVQIAQGLKESKDYVGKHLALLDAPEFIQEALLNGVITGMQSAYRLFLIYKKDPNAALRLLKSSDGVTQSDIAATLKSLNTSSGDDRRTLDEQNLHNQESNSSAVMQTILDNSTTHFELSLDKDAKEIDGDRSPNEAGEEGKIVAFRAKSATADLQNLEGNPTQPKKLALDKTTRLAISGFINNLGLQIGNKTAKKIVFSHNEAITLKTLLEGLL